MSPYTFTKRVGHDFAFNPSRTYTQDQDCKPTGFWVSVDGDWERWLSDEGLDGDEWGVRTVTIDLDADACLWITSVEELDDFHDNYATPHAGVFCGRPDYYRIDWEPLTAQWSGIVIAPYLWERRLGPGASRWYYPWDAASGCIWDLSAIRGAA
ncbi:MAG: hypothetical protein EKK65_11140 [Lysobacterales bacterium]|nr:MAG: hypothetical protein EKK65_11140 [Xanthomonadales bacterium]